MILSRDRGGDMDQEKKEKQERQEFSYHCEICKTKYSEGEAKTKKICCDNELTPLRDLYRSDPSPSGP